MWQCVTWLLHEHFMIRIKPNRNFQVYYCTILFRGNTGNEAIKKIHEGGYAISPI